MVDPEDYRLYTWADWSRLAPRDGDAFIQAVRVRLRVPEVVVLAAYDKLPSAAVSFSRGLFGHAPNPAFVEKVLRSLSLWDKRDSKIMALSGGMKRRVMIAKALVHEP